MYHGRCFNPYFNGYCISTRTRKNRYTPIESFNPYFNGYCISTGENALGTLKQIDVLILILMDIAFQQVFSPNPL